MGAGKATFTYFAVGGQDALTLAKVTKKIVEGGVLEYNIFLYHFKVK
jgi:hypothetical protein